MAEIRLQIRITERNIERIGIVRNRHELRSRRLGRTSEIKSAHISIVIDIIPEHCRRRPVHDGIVITLAVGLIVRDRRNHRSADLRAELVLLVHEIETRAMRLVLVQNVAGICVVAHHPVLDELQFLDVGTGGRIISVLR